MPGQVEQLLQTPVIEDEGWNGYQHFTDPTRLPFNVLTYPSQNCSMPSHDKIVPDLGKKTLGQQWTDDVGMKGNKEKYTTLAGVELEVRVWQAELAIEINNKTGDFAIGETITGSSSHSTATVVSKNEIDALNFELILTDITGKFTTSDTVTGGTSGATADVTLNNANRGDVIEVLYTDTNPDGAFYNIPHWYAITKIDNSLPIGLHRYSFDQWFDTNLNPSESLNIPRLIWVNGLKKVFSWVGGIASIVDVTEELSSGDTYASVDVGTLNLYSTVGVIGSFNNTQDTQTPIHSGSVISEGQSFQNANISILDSVKFYIKKFGAPTGNVTATIYASTGSLGTTSKPTGAVLATSDSISIASLTTGYVFTKFQFTGINRITLSAATNYVVVLNYSGGDGSNYLDVGIDTLHPSGVGNSSFSTDDTTWTAESGHNCLFYIYGTSTPAGGPFLVGEIVQGPSGSGMVAEISDLFSPLTLVKTAGTFTVGDAVYGLTSGETGTVLSYIPPSITWASLGFLQGESSSFKIGDTVYAISSGWGTESVVYTPTLPTVHPGDIGFSVIRADDVEVAFDFCRQTKNYMYYGNWNQRQLYQSNAFNRDADAVITNETIIPDGLDDLYIPSVTTYTGTGSAVYKVIINNGTSNPNSFDWYKNGIYKASINIDHTMPQLLDDGIYIQFVYNIDHTVGSSWEITATQAITDAWFNFYYSLPIRRPGEGYIFRLPSNFWTMDVQEDKLYVNTKFGEWSIIDTVLSSDLQNETVSLVPLKQSGALKVIDPWMTGHMEDNLVFVTLDKSLMNMGRQAFLQEPQDGYMSDPVKYDFLPCSFIGGGIKYIGKRLYITSPEQGIMHCLDVAKKYWQPPKTFPEMGIPSIVGNDLIVHSNIRNQTFTMFANVSDNGQSYLVLARTPFNPYFKLVARKRIPARWDSKYSSNTFIEGYIQGNPQLIFTCLLGPNDPNGLSHEVEPIITNNPSDKASIGQGSLGTHPLGNDLFIEGSYFNEIYNKFKPIMSYYFIALQISCVSKNHSYSVLAIGVNMSFAPTGNNTLIGDREIL